MKRPASDKRTVSRSLCRRQDILQKGLAVPQQAGMRGQYTAALPHPIFSSLQRKEPNGVGVEELALLERMFMVLLFFIKCNYVWGYPLHIGEVASQFSGKCSIVGYFLLLSSRIFPLSLIENIQVMLIGQHGYIDTTTSVISALRRPGLQGHEFQASTDYKYLRRISA